MALRKFEFLYWNSNFLKFCLVIRMQPISVLKSFLLYYMFCHVKSYFYTLSWKLHNCFCPIAIGCLCALHTALHVSTMWVGKCTKPFLRGKMLHTHSSRKLEFLLGIEHQNIVFQAEIQFFFQQSKTYFWPWMGSYEPKRPWKYIIQSWFWIRNKKLYYF